MIGLADSSQAPRERHAVFGLQLQVQHDEVDDALGEHGLHGAAVGDGGDAQLVLAEVVGNELADLRVVVDREHVRSGRRL